MRTGAVLWQLALLFYLLVTRNISRWHIIVFFVNSDIYWYLYSFTLCEWEMTSFDDIFTHLRFICWNAARQRICTSRSRNCRTAAYDFILYFARFFCLRKAQISTQLTIRYERPCRSVFTRQASTALTNWNSDCFGSGAILTRTLSIHLLTSGV